MAEEPSNVESAGFELVSEQIEVDCICAGCATR